MVTNQGRGRKDIFTLQGSSRQTKQQYRHYNIQQIELSFKANFSFFS